MNWGAWAVWGLVATVALTTLMAGGQGLGLTRMNLPFLLGTIFTPDRDRARLLGILVQLANGWIFALAYAFAFQVWGEATWWIGALGGLVHSAFVLTVIMPVLPGLHPRMASEHKGPTAHRQLEPPGFLGLHYGYRTPLSVVVSHVVYGILLGSLYRVA